MFPGSIHKVVGERQGKTVAVFAGVHGNERAGIMAVQKAISEITITSGTVYFVLANPPAIEKNIRLIDHNLNRLFNRSLSGEGYEYQRAAELMDVLDTCDALLDLHSYNSDFGDPFVIAEPNAKGITDLLGVTFVAEGFGDLGYGSDDYMYKQGKIGICLECGTSNRYEEFVPFALQSIKIFLQYFDCIPKGTIAEHRYTQQKIRAKRIIYKQNKDFSFVKNFYDFEPLPPGEIFAIDGDCELRAQHDEVILFPRPGVAIGEEVCIIGETIK